MYQRDKILNALRNAMSSEHTSYKSTKKYLSSLPTTGKYVVVGPGENAGILYLGKGWALALRIESHNHPTFINPYKGAASGVGGILRDIFTMGARPVALLDFLYFGADSHSQSLLWKTVRGIADYGNCVGVPTLGGTINFDKTYNTNCLVNVFAAGLLRKDKLVFGRAETPGSDLIYVGARTGMDGVGGAEMASATLEKLDEGYVQDADPFLEKLLLEACHELAEENLVEGMQDMGAAGLLCSTAETVLRGKKKTGRNLGAKLYLNRIPLKSKDMSPVEILLSESQERMMIIGKRKNRQKILRIFKKWDLEACVAGEVTKDGNYTIVYDKGKQKNLINRYPLTDVFPEPFEEWPLKPWSSQKSVLLDPDKNLKSKIWHQYDWMVGTRTIKGPNKSGHYAILDLPELKKELVISWGSDEGKSDINPKLGAQFAFDRCLKNIRKLRATPLGLVNCLNFGHPKDSMEALAETLDGLKERC